MKTLALSDIVSSILVALPGGSNGLQAQLADT